MERITETADNVLRLQSKRETSLTQTEPTTLSVNFDSPQAKLYAADVTAIVKRSLELANFPPLEATKQLPRRVGIWTEFLLTRVPADRLFECWDAAIGAHDGTYPLAATEINEAWRAIQEREKMEADLKARQEAHLLPKRCTFHHNNEEEKLVPIYNMRVGDDVLMPCPSCRPEDFAERRAQLQMEPQTLHAVVDQLT